MPQRWKPYYLLSKINVDRPAHVLFRQLCGSCSHCENLPGQSTVGTIGTLAAALFAPLSGALQGTLALSRGILTAKTSLQRAARAGALCMVVKMPEIHLSRVYFSKSRLAEVLPATNGHRASKNVFHGSSWAMPVASGICADGGTELRHVRGRRPGPGSDGRCRLSQSFQDHHCNSPSSSCIFNGVQVYRRSNRAVWIRFFWVDRDSIRCHVDCQPVGNLLCPEYAAMYLVETRVLRDLRSSHQLVSVRNRNHQH